MGVNKPKWNSCITCSKSFETKAEADACTHEPDQPDEAAVFFFSPIWWLMRLFKRGIADAVAEGNARTTEGR